MNYNIHINQYAIIKNGLDLHPFDAIILDGFKSMFSAHGMETKLIDGKVFYWVATSKLMDDLPILTKVMTTKRAWQKRISNLIEQGLLVKNLVGKDSKTFYTQGKKWNLLVCTDKATPMNENSHPHEPVFIPPHEPVFTPPMNEGSYNHNTNNHNTNIPSLSESDFSSGSSLFDQTVKVYGYPSGIEEAWKKHYKWLSAMDKERVLAGAKVWAEYYKAKGTLGTEYQKSLCSFISGKYYKEQPPKIAVKNGEQKPTAFRMQPRKQITYGRDKH